MASVDRTRLGIFPRLEMGGRGKRSHAQVAVWLKRLATAAFSFELKLRHAARTGRRRQPGRLLCGVLGHCGPMATRSLDLETREGRAERRARLLRLEQAHVLASMLGRCSCTTGVTGLSSSSRLISNRAIIPGSKDTSSR